MDQVSEEGFRSVIRSFNWYLKRNKSYGVTEFNTWATNHATEITAIKSKIVGFDYSNLVKSTETYFNHLNNKIQSVDETFLKQYDDLEIFLDSDVMSRHQEIFLKDKVEPLENATANLAKLNLKTTVNVDNLTGNEEDINEWIESFERISNASGWTKEIRSIKLPTYLKETALMVWQSLSSTDKNDYDKIKSSILKELTVPELEEETFHSKQQKESETVIEYYFTLAKLATKAYPDLKHEDREKIILKKFINSVLPKIKKILLVADPKTSEAVKQMARRAEACLKEEENSKQINAVITPDIKEKLDRRSRWSSESSQGSQRGSGDRRRSPTPFRRNMQNSRSRGSGSMECFKCKQKGHMAKDCSNNRSSFDEKKKTICFKCNKPGHIASKCWSK